MSARHTPVTSRIQSRLERWELEHLRALAAEHAERIEALEAQVAELQREVIAADDCGNMWRDACMRFEGTVDDGGATLAIGLTITGDVVPVREGARQ